MGRDVHNLDLETVLRAGHENEDATVIKGAFSGFDAEKCSCYIAEDKDRMLDIIYAAFGTMPAFNEAVQRILQQTRLASWQYSRSEDFESVSCTSRDVERNDEVPLDSV